MENNSTKRLWPWPFVTEVLLLLWCFYSKNTWLVVLHLDFTMPWKKLNYFAVVWQQMLKSILDLRIWLSSDFFFDFVQPVSPRTHEVSHLSCCMWWNFTLDHPKPPFLTQHLGSIFFEAFSIGIFESQIGPRYVKKAVHLASHGKYRKKVTWALKTGALIVDRVYKGLYYTSGL